MLRLSHIAIARNVAACALALALALAASATIAHAQTFRVTCAASTCIRPLTGRVVIVVAKTQQPEPRIAISPRGPALFACDVEAQPSGKAFAITPANALGYPSPLDQLPAGDYYVQAVVNVYEEVHRADGHVLWLHMNDGSIEPFNDAAGNIYSDVQRVHLDKNAIIDVALNKTIPTPTKPADTQWLRHVTIQSALLTKFWGRPIFIHATVLLPQGYDSHSNVYYPSIYTLGHGVPFNFDTDTTPTNERGKINPVTNVKSGYDMYVAWKSKDFPRLIAITLEQQTPYFPDSYAVNSVNNGPYGDAMIQEVIPELERRFRIIPKPYARILEGASTSGWQTLAMQLQHPSFFGGSWILQPDPIDFRHYQLTNIYDDANAFTMPAGPFETVERPFRRTTEGQVVWTTRQISLFEEVLGTKGRSGYQYAAWNAVYGPMDNEGYPKPVWNNITGEIDHDVAKYMKDNGYDLRAYAEKNWTTIGPKIIGKLHFFAGDMDDFYLNLAVYDFQDFLAHTSHPHYAGEFTYGRPKKGHSWHATSWEGFARQMADYVRKNTPPGTAVTWMY